MIQKQEANNFENLNFNPFLKQKNILINNDFDADNNFFNENTFQNLNANYFSEEEFKDKLNTQSNNLPFLYYI